MLNILALEPFTDTPAENIALHIKERLEKTSTSQAEEELKRLKQLLSHPEIHKPDNVCQAIILIVSNSDVDPSIVALTIQLAEDMNLFQIDLGEETANQHQTNSSVIQALTSFTQAAQVNEDLQHKIFT